MQKLVIKVTDHKTEEPKLIGVPSIIQIYTGWEVITKSGEKVRISVIKLRSAMVSEVVCLESVEEIFNLINN